MTNDTMLVALGDKKLFTNNRSYRDKEKTICRK